jgi:hypothetical protein
MLSKNGRRLQDKKWWPSLTNEMKQSDIAHLRLVCGFPTLYCSPAGSIRRDQAAGFPPAHVEFGGGGGSAMGLVRLL